jgi:hypothetical protein
MNIASLGTLVSALAAVLFIILALATFRARRNSREVTDLRQVRATNVAALQWAYRVQTLAAIKGWDLPPIPKEMTPEYLIGKSEGNDGNPELAQLAQLASGLIPGQTVHTEGNKS